jgi:hypothetical protein
MNREVGSMTNVAVTTLPSIPFIPGADV